MTPVILASMSLIGLTGIFAWHNRRTGWVKQRGPSVLETLITMQHCEEFATGSATEATAVADNPVTQTITRMTPQAEAEFSLQLAGLAQGLGTSTPITAPSPVEAETGVAASYSN